MILWIASGNRNKTQELLYFCSLYFPDLELRARAAQQAEESGATYAENARIKAEALATELRNEGKMNFLVLGDDSGLEVDLLGGAPGLRSARYSGGTTCQNVEKLLKELAPLSSRLEERQGRYQCALHLMQVSEERGMAAWSAQGQREGFVAHSPRGAFGYAYDGIFLDPVSLKTYGEIPFTIKQKDSHRQRAFERLAQQFVMGPQK